MNSQESSGIPKNLQEFPEISGANQGGSKTFLFAANIDIFEPGRAAAGPEQPIKEIQGIPEISRISTNFQEISRIFKKFHGISGTVQKC